MHITIWGSRGSVPVSGSAYSRYGGATTCLEVEFPLCGRRTPERIIIDCGSGLASLGRSWGARSPRGLFLLTHMHWDHIQGFPFFGPLYRPSAEFDLWAHPRNGHDADIALATQMSHPTFPVPFEALRHRLNLRSLPDSGTELRGEVSIRWAEMSHPSGSSAFRLDYRGRSLVFSGDVEVREGSEDDLIAFAQDADVLIMDAAYTEAEYSARRGWGHSTTDDAVRVAEAAGCRAVILTHHDPGHSDRELDEMLQHARQLASGLLIDNAFDGLRLSLAPAYSAQAIREGVGV